MTGYILAGAVASPLCVYLVARLATAAYFSSKWQYERRANHG